MKRLKQQVCPQLNGSAEYQYFIEVPAMPLPKEFDPTGEGGTIGLS
ncbi:MAG: hypothetical protein IPI15_18335 [Saprospiraceae bacterium]|nr:hypothetical protein [Candidatus Brachybacter algidus]MBK7605482.1 hypothetical protein [Candidatus Brachybacter algidus]